MVNSGQRIPRDAIAALYQPFQRHGHRSARADGHGLGLSIVAAVATAHRAQIITEPGTEGGLDVTVVFPSPKDPGPGLARLTA